MKIFERLLNNHIRDIVEITANQARLDNNYGPTDVIHVPGLFMEKHREKHRPFNIAFQDLENAFDNIPHELIWCALRHLVPQESARWVKLLY